MLHVRAAGRSHIPQVFLRTHLPPKPNDSPERTTALHGDNRKSTRSRTELTTDGVPAHCYQGRVYNTAFMRKYLFSHPAPRHGRES
jgi:hypothetical protein